MPRRRAHGSCNDRANDEPLSFAEQLREFLRRNATWFLAAGFTLLVLQDVFGTHGVMAMRHAQKEAASVQKEIDQINEENRQLQDRVKALKNDEQSIEHIAREELGRPGPASTFSRLAAQAR